MRRDRDKMFELSNDEMAVVRGVLLGWGRVRTCCERIVGRDRRQPMGVAGSPQHVTPEVPWRATTAAQQTQPPCSNTCHRGCHTASIFVERISLTTYDSKSPTCAILWPRQRGDCAFDCLGGEPGHGTYRGTWTKASQADSTRHDITIAFRALPLRAFLQDLRVGRGRWKDVWHFNRQRLW